MSFISADLVQSYADWAVSLILSPAMGRAMFLLPLDFMIQFYAIILTDKMVLVGFGVTFIWVVVLPIIFAILTGMTLFDTFEKPKTIELFMDRKSEL